MRALVFAGLIMVGYAVLSLPVFQISRIEIYGNEKVTNSQILEACGLTGTDNIFAFNKSKSEATLKKIPYIADVEITKKYPDEVDINVKERRVSGYVQDIDNYLYIDKDGRVLDVKKTFSQRLPVVVGLDFKDFNIGQILQVSNKNSFSIVVELAYLFDTYDILDDVVRVDVKNEDDIHIFIYNLDVEFGGISDANEKIQILKQSVEAIPNAKTIKGFLNLKVRNGSEVGRFRILT